MPAASIRTLVAELKQRHAAMAASEEEALAALGRNDEVAYRQLMEHRAMLVAALDDAPAADLVAGLPEPLRAEVKGSLRRFAQSARTGLGIGSVFYYSALLYPDEHQKGEPDNLARLIEKLENTLALL